MEMNANQMHQLFRQEADEIETDDINWSEIDRLLALAIDDTIQDRYNNIFVNKKYSVQSALRVMQELSALTKENNSYVITGNDVPIPVDNYFPLAIQVTINGKKDYCDFVSFDFIKGNKNNPFRKPSAIHPKAVIMGSVIRIYPGTGNTLSLTAGTSNLFYIKRPTYPENNETVQYTSASSLTTGWKMYVWSGSVTYNSGTYTVGQTFIVVTGIPSFTGSGICIKIIDTDVNWQLHDEIVRKAVALSKTRVYDYELSNQIKLKELDS